MPRTDDHRHFDNPPLADHAVHFLIGIDDTDNAESRGTGYLVRGLAGEMARRGMAHIFDVTRHQLLIDPRVRYTSRNGALCLHVAALPMSGDEIWAVCQGYVLAHAAEGSDAGLAMTRWDRVPPQVEAFGTEAQSRFIELAEAEQVAVAADIPLVGLTGDRGGKIGALAAIGLRHAARNGRVAWGPGLRDMRDIVTVGDLLDRTSIQAVRASSPDAARQPEREDRVRLESWARAVMIDGMVVALVERDTDEHAKTEWSLVGRDILHDF